MRKSQEAEYFLNAPHAYSIALQPSWTMVVSGRSISTGHFSSWSSIPPPVFPFTPQRLPTSPQVAAGNRGRYITVTTGSSSRSMSSENCVCVWVLFRPKWFSGCTCITSLEENRWVLDGSGRPAHKNAHTRISTCMDTQMHLILQLVVY